VANKGWRVGRVNGKFVAGVAARPMRGGHDTGRKPVLDLGVLVATV
jgi:hypothetical protein